jgi:membrane protease YdiL (CAAX protease family)
MHGTQLFATVTLEVVFALVLFIFTLDMTRMMIHYIAEYITGIPRTEQPQLVSGIASILSTTTCIIAVFFQYAIWRRFKWTDMWAALGLDRVHLSGIAIATIVMHACGFLLMCAYQHYRGEWLYSLANYQVDGKFSMATVLDMLLLAPFREEILFRGLFCAIFVYRLDGHHITRDTTKHVSATAVILPSVLFGAMHLLNFTGDRYSATYIVLQVSLGLLIASLYVLRFVITACLWEPIILHIANNAFSSFLPIDHDFDFSDPFIAFALMQTIVVYGILIVISIRQLHAAHTVGISSSDKKEQ